MKKLALVTGAAGGIGYACGVALARDYEVLLTDLDPVALDAAAQRFSEEAGATAATVACDITDHEAVENLANSVEAADAPLGALAHAAGISPVMATGREIVDVDLIGSERLLQAVLPHASEGAAIVSIASVAGGVDPQMPQVDALLDDPLSEGMLDRLEAALPMELDPSFGYVLAKRGVIRMSERLAADWGERGIRVVSVSPGLIDTPMGRQELEGNPMTGFLAQNTPLKRAPRPGQSAMPGRAEDVAAVVAFLCSYKAGFVSGCDVRVDGGLIGAGNHGRYAVDDMAADEQ